MPCVGFTGTREKITNAQLKSLFVELNELQLTHEEFHHGDCVGADQSAFLIATILGYRTIMHPPNVMTHRAFTTSDEIREPKGYIDRNHDIVDDTDILIACPRLKYEENRSGTWATVRYARKLERPVIIISPDGYVTS